MPSVIRNHIKANFPQNPGLRPAILLSGGLDSTIILHHLCELYPPACIDAITVGFGTSKDPREEAERVARHYGVRYHFIDIHEEFVGELPQILCHFPKPQWNVWPWFAIKYAATKCKANAIFTGEGADEHFGGYDHGSYLRGWAGQLMYVQPAFQIPCNFLNVELYQPFLNLDRHAMTPYFAPPDKFFLRQAYADLLPYWQTFTNRPAVGANYLEIWNTTWRKHFPSYNPTSKEDARNLIQRLITTIWLGARKWTTSAVPSPSSGTPSTNVWTSFGPLPGSCS